MAPYHPPSGGRRNKLRLDFNENTVGAPPHVLDFIKRFLTAADLSIYPEYDHALEDLSQSFRCRLPDELTLTNGTDEAIQLLVNTFINRGRPGHHPAAFLCDVPLLLRSWRARASKK